MEKEINEVELSNEFFHALSEMIEEPGRDELEEEEPETQDNELQEIGGHLHEDGDGET